MRFLFKTRYQQDLALIEHGGQRFWYGLLLAALAAAPWVLPAYLVSQLVFVLIYGKVRRFIGVNRMQWAITGAAPIYAAKLDVHVAGSGTVYYRGNAAVTQKITGSGEVKKL